jgi:predicted RNA binding protein YcfA (HicA-like mRNA interferase family)
MGKLRILSGKQVCRLLEDHGFQEVRRRGSHVVMQLRSDEGTTTIPVPDHAELSAGRFYRLFAKAACPGPYLKLK